MPKSLFSMSVCMLVMGVANPSGEADSYNGLYFTQQELNSLTTAHKLNNVPVKAEHKGNAVGHIVSSFVDDRGKLNCIMHIDENEVEGAVCAGLVRDGIASELSLGYQVDVKHSADSAASTLAREFVSVNLLVFPWSHIFIGTLSP